MAEFIITAVNIFILFFLVGYFGSGMVSKFLAKRKAGIVESIDSAAAQKVAATKNLKVYQEKVENFESERQQILERAAQRAKRREDDIIAEARKEAERIISRANKEAELKRLKLKDDIKHDMVVYATAAASRIITENMTDSIQDALIEDTLREMGEATWQD